MRCGLLGEKLVHSYSPQIHSHLADYIYELIEKKPGELDVFFSECAYHGLNVTIPYKKSVIPYCSELTPLAQKLGSVNTIVRKADGSLIGHNTDYFGFSSLLIHSGLCVSGKKVLVLGSGGSSVTVTAVLKDLGADPIVISRSGEHNYSNLHQQSDAAAIINTTPVGMYPNTGETLIDLSLFPKLEGVIDIIYNPFRTKLLMDAQSRGLIAENGLWMLVAQAKESAQWFAGCKIDDAQIHRIHSILKQQMENIVLIGMPGCGKSTIGRILAQLANKEFIDADETIVKKAGITIPEIFDKFGEDGFRAIEAEVLRDLGKRASAVIATGGGCVTRSENYPSLHQNGTIIWLRRQLELLPKDGRPLSQKNDLEKMYRIREPLYAEFSDLSVENNADPLSIANRIIALLNKEMAE